MMLCSPMSFRLQVSVKSLLSMNSMALKRGRKRARDAGRTYCVASAARGGAALKRLEEREADLQVIHERCVAAAAWSALARAQGLVVVEQALEDLLQDMRSAGA